MINNDDKLNRDEFDSKLIKDKALMTEKAWEDVLNRVLLDARKTLLDFHKLQNQTAEKFGNTQLRVNKEVFNQRRKLFEKELDFEDSLFERSTTSNNALKEKLQKIYHLQELDNISQQMKEMQTSLETQRGQRLKNKEEELAQIKNNLDTELQNAIQSINEQFERRKNLVSHSAQLQKELEQERLQAIKVQEEAIENSRKEQVNKKQLDYAKEDKDFEDRLEKQSKLLQDVDEKLNEGKQQYNKSLNKIEAIRQAKLYAQRSLYEKKLYQEQIVNRNKNKLDELNTAKQISDEKLHLLKTQLSSDISAEERVNLEEQKEKLLETQSQISKEMLDASWEQQQAQKISLALEDALEKRQYEKLGLVDRYVKRFKENKDIEEELNELETKSFAEKQANLKELQSAQDYYDTVKDSSLHNELEKQQALEAVELAREKLHQQSIINGERQSELQAKQQKIQTDLNVLSPMVKHTTAARELINEEKSKQAQKASEKYLSIKSAMSSELASAKTKEEKQEIRNKYKQPLKEAKSERDKSASELTELDVQVEQFFDWFKQDFVALDAKQNADFGEKLSKNVAKSFTDGIGTLSGKFFDGLNKIDGYISEFYQYQSKMEARLQGSQKSYADILKTVSKNVGISPFVSQKELVQNIRALVDEGIAYDLELRAFLATVSDDIASTFNALNPTLLRLIRLQQADTTAARLGVEAALTKFLNTMFSDTNYLKDVYDTVSSALIDANSQLSRDQAIEFEYILQKWLGALYSVGLSSDAINKIATGMGYLATGDVESLTNDNALMTLLGMAASKSGISIGESLNEGITGSEANLLLESMVNYLQEIAANTDSKVTKSAYGNLLGLSMSDLTAVSNLTQVDIKGISNNTMNYASAMKELETQLNSVSKRIHISQLMNTVLENAMVSAATNIGANAGVYAGWMVTNIIEDLTGGIAIPAVSIMGNMVDLHATVTGLVKAGIAGVSLMTSLLSSVTNIGKGGPFSVGTWGYEQYTARGTAPKTNIKGVETGISRSEELSSRTASGGDVQQATLADAKKSAKEDKTNADIAPEKTVVDVYKEFFQTKTPIEVHSSVVDSLYNDLFTKSLLVSMDKSIYEPILGYLSTISQSLAGTLSVAVAGMTESATPIVTTVTGIQQLASGALTAQKGVTMVGETGPELVLMRGGETVFNSKQTSSLLTTSNGKSSSILNLIKSMQTDYASSTDISTMTSKELETGIQTLFAINTIISNLSKTSFLNTESSRGIIQTLSDVSVNNDLLYSLWSAQSTNANTTNMSQLVDSVSTSTHASATQKSFIQVVSDIEQSSLSLCDKIETLNLVIEQLKSEQLTSQSNNLVSVKLAEIDETLNTNIKNYIEQQLFSILLSAVAKGFSQNATEDGDSIMSMLKKLSEKTFDTNIRNNNFDEVLNTLMYRSNM